jgi:hypothetical protein
MKNKQKIGAGFIFGIILIIGIFWFDPEQPLNQGMLIMTAVPKGIDLSGSDMGVDGRYIPQAQIIAVDMERKEKKEILLSEGFYSARSPEILWNGREMVFCGQKNEGDTWQIYVKDLETLLERQITHCPVNCTDPAWLPDGRIVFSRLDEEDKPGRIHVLYACDPDGSHQERLMFHPNSAISASVLRDGRILTISEQRFPETSGKKMLVLRIDGTKSELFYESRIHAIPASREWETNDGMLYFVEKLPGNLKTGHLVSVDQGHPLSSWEDMSGGIQGSFHSLYPASTRHLTVSYHPEGVPNFGIYLFDINTRKILREVYLNEDYHLIEPVIMRSREVPMRIPSIVDMSKEKGTLLCHNADESSMPVIGKTEEESKTATIRVIGVDGLLGEIPVEADGSFYIEVDADLPIRFQTLNAAGDILRGPSDWVWVRPNERRSCIGCHEDREMAPENKVPMALYKGMVALPEGTKSEPVILSENYGKK